ncbi:homoserine dehydrogenase [Fistulifera solaris]|uniref:Homoserine dehydrogenase n=1 Tax=Fistulifera solaris TaxID=1519565 RepID=A0A1Z5KNC2_FISSO|nr:homoserine dehydrogenase [Fistulifera solaris]|eukprot:GAX27779.1 homoserine dehydrogenase [Fistulifera solaris]
MKPLRIGMYGGGTVGGGVYELIMKNKASNIVISKICVRDLNKPRTFQIDESVTTLTADAEEMMKSDDIDCVVEVMGGTGLAKKVVESALKQGKPVVTANKTLLAEHWGELQDIIKNNQTASLHWEAAVCGGIPIIQTLQSCYTGDEISSIAGICNGTTNYMLTKMSTGAADYDDVLKEAQELGYAEADPTADVEGHDVRAKIALLAGVAFGVPVPPVDKIPCVGISKITSADFGYASQMNSTIKLLGTAKKTAENKLAVYVSPAMVSMQVHSVAHCSGVGNVVSVTSSNLGTCSYSGPGAGRYPTANSIVADIYRVASGASSNAVGTSDAKELELDCNYVAKFYVRVSLVKGMNVPVAETGALAEKHGVSINSIMSGDGNFCVTTNDSKLGNIQVFVEELAKTTFCNGMPCFMPLLSN